jgi:hypothetical protein
MPAMPSITIVKEFTYRGKQEEWSNTYSFSGPVPADNPAWLALGNAIWDQEKRVLDQTVKVVQYYGYTAGAVASVAQLDRRLEPTTGRTGLLVPGVGDKMAGDQAMTIRALVGNSVKGKKVYIRKFYHGSQESATDPDKLATAVLTTANDVALQLTNGTLPDGRKWCSPSGAVATQPAAQVFLTTRTLKRRGKRPLG